MAEAPTALESDVRRVIAEASGAALARSRDAFVGRAVATERLDVHVIDRLRELEERGESSSALRALLARATGLKRRWETANKRFSSRLRTRVRDGRYTRTGLARALARRAEAGRGTGGYDALDLLVAGLLDAGGLADERAAREPDMVAYQPTPGRAILQLIERAELRAGDVLVDLGSGLGSVVILVALLSDARAVGVEIEPAFVAYARRCARRLNVARASFVEADARAASLADATVFFLYTPFRGNMLQHVLERLRVEAESRAIRVCTYGPCTAEVARVAWLVPRAAAASGEHEIAVFDRRSGP